MNLLKNDLLKIGHTNYNENGFITIISPDSTANIEEILLREILLKFGNYRITSIIEYVCECCGESDIIFKTNLPVRLVDNMIKLQKD